VVACAEVGLGGELRQVAQLERRLREAARLGFGAALVASSVTVSVPGMELLPCATLREALGVFQIPGGTMRTRGDLA
jgi:DNA repair protein RadA/Sms